MVLTIATIGVIQKHKIKLASFLLPGVIILDFESLVLFVRSCVAAAFGVIDNPHYLSSLHSQLVLVSGFLHLVFLSIVHILTLFILLVALLFAVDALLPMKLLLIPASDDRARVLLLC